MRRLSGVLLAGAILMLPAFSQSAFAQAAPQKLTFQGDTVVWMVTVKPGKEADFEEVIAALKMALQTSEAPEAKQQAAGWKVVKGPAQPDGSVVYAHIISPVVPGADYGVMANIYASVKDPAQQKVLFDKYAGAFNANLLQVPMTTVNNLGQ